MSPKLIPIQNFHRFGGCAYCADYLIQVAFHKEFDMLGDLGPMEAHASMTDEEFELDKIWGVLAGTLAKYAIQIKMEDDWRLPDGYL